jgi:hypothetical protein
MAQSVQSILARTDAHPMGSMRSALERAGGSPKALVCLLVLAKMPRNICRLFAHFAGAPKTPPRQPDSAARLVQRVWEANWLLGRHWVGLCFGDPRVACPRPPMLRLAMPVVPL